MDARSRIATGDLRRHHLGLVLDAVVRHPPITRAAVAARTGLTRSTVSGLTAELLGGGLVRDIGTGPQTGTGRPGHRLVPDPAGPVGIGLQIEPDGVGGCLVDLAGSAGARRWRTVALAGAEPAAAARAAQPVLRELLLAAAAGDRVVAGIVAAVPGVVAADDRTVREAPSLDWCDADLGGLLAAEADAVGAGGITLTVRCGVTLAASLEPTPASPAPMVFVGGRSEVGVVLLPGTGAGGGDAAIRFGHLPARAGGERCRCGRRGCVSVETRPVTADAPAATGRALRRAGRALGVALAGFAAPLRPGTVVLGGRFTAAAPEFVAAVTAELGRHGIGADRLLRSTLGADAVLRGAGGAAVTGLVADPGRWLGC
ncbi:MarR family transcriptional regulator [Pseudonocardia nantongensis]|uniref:ROK family transcriptional regulator n=1 Tax=Pseudonocardia nantongensis TaxID=1181885 RepID=UPI0039789957